MEIQILGELELLERIESGGHTASHCISIVDPGRSMPELIREHFQEVLELSFWDANSKKELTHLHPKRLVMKSDIRRILRFARRTQNRATGYTIHCWRGISRSAAVGLGLLRLFSGRDDEAARQLIRIRRNAMPLKRVVELFDKRFGSNLAQADD